MTMTRDCYNALCHSQVLSYLLERGSDVHAADNFALRWACSHGRCDVATWETARIRRLWQYMYRQHLPSRCSHLARSCGGM